MTYLPEVFYTTKPSVEAVVWTGAFTVVFVLTLVFCWWREK